MINQVADWAAGRLAADEEIIVPVKKLWSELTKAMPGHGLTPEAFAALLESDERFAMHEGIDHGDGDPEERAEMEKLGFWSGPCVQLVGREITPEYLARKITESNQRMMQALAAAWDASAEDMSPEEEAQFLHLMTLAEQISAHAKQVAADIRQKEQPGHER